MWRWLTPAVAQMKTSRCRSLKLVSLLSQSIWHSGSRRSWSTCSESSKTRSISTILSRAVLWNDLKTSSPAWKALWSSLLLRLTASLRWVCFQGRTPISTCDSRSTLWSMMCSSVVRRSLFQGKSRSKKFKTSKINDQVKWWVDMLTNLSKNEELTLF